MEEKKKIREMQLPGNAGGKGAYMPENLKSLASAQMEATIHGALRFTIIYLGYIGQQISYF